MILLKILLLFCCFPLLYVLRKLIRRENINVFDLLLLWHIFYFCIIPIKSNIQTFQILFSANFETPTTLEYVGIIAGFVYTLLYVDYRWTKNNGTKNNILNISLYLRNLAPIRTSKILLILLALNLFVSFMWYIPSVSYVSVFASETEGVVSKEAVFYSSVYQICITIILIIVIQKWLNEKKIEKLMLILLACYAFSLILLPRRILTNYILFIVFLVYSFVPQAFNIKRIFISCIALLFIFEVYFPFYNVMRFTSVASTSSNPIENTLNLLDATISNYDEGKKKAELMTEGRTLGLFNALYRLIENDSSPSCGQLFLESIDFAMPSFLNKNKGSGTQILLEKKAHSTVDQADSFLLMGYGDFGFFLGGPYSMLIYYMILFIYKILSQISNCFLYKGNFVNGYICSLLFLFSYNLESDFEGLLANIFSFIPIQIVLILLCKYNVIKVKK